MAIYSTATPCPVSLISTLPSPLSSNSRRQSTASQDVTAELDYTRAIQAEFAKARPRRRHTFQRKKAAQAAVAVFEDVVEDEELVLQDEIGVGSGMLLGRPAQRLPLRQPTRVAPETTEAPLQVIRQARKRTSIASEGVSRKEATVAETGQEAHKPKLFIEKPVHIWKDPRRRTIFIPSDDTTIATIHPGARTLDILEDTFQLSVPSNTGAVREEKSTFIQQMPQPEQGRRLRMSLAAVPRRIPLQHITARQSTTTTEDVVGKGNGKENVPPGLRTENEHETCTNTCQYAAAGQLNVNPKSSLDGRSTPLEPTAASQARQSVLVRTTSPAAPLGPLKAVPIQRRVRNKTECSRPITRAPKSAGKDSGKPVRPDRPPRKAEDFQKTQQTSSKLGLRHSFMVKEDDLAQKYPALTNNVLRPELYEDNWLGHQEVALTELLNVVLEKSTFQTRPWEQLDETLHERMLALYHTLEVSALHKRLHASLLYGVLSPPKHKVSPPRLTEDLGLRRRFLLLWLDSYDEDYLRLAAEVVVGRQTTTRDNSSRIFSTLTSPQAPSSSLNPQSKRRSLIEFLETFFIKVSDLTEEDGRSPSYAITDLEIRRWQKTVLRSLMLVQLLDKTKSSGAMTRCLFNRKSVQKSSGIVLNNLAMLLIPSVGDISRALRYMDYEVSYVQDPLEVVVYRVDNLAIDLRDGILLTRLIELLLYPTHPIVAASTPEGVTLTVDLNHPDSSKKWPLSQHLKMPCLGRAQKLCNVHLALGALNHGFADVVTVSALPTAGDIVDGNREKTLSLLWALMSRFGLPLLVDSNDLRRESKMFAAGEDCTSDSEIVLDGNLETNSEQQLLEIHLFRWAHLICAAKRIVVSNLTTSFADGKALETIIDTYTIMLPRAITARYSSTADLRSKLRCLGCSSAVADSFRSGFAIPSRDTTISNLALLAALLLPLARTHRAASVIQRAFQARQNRISIRRHVVLMRLAHDCAAVMQARERVCDAATVLQRTWRRVLAARTAALMRDVGAFQCMVRGWSARREQRASLLGLNGNSRMLLLGVEW